MKLKKIVNSCLCCGSKNFNYNDVLWPDLIKQWRLSDKEVEYINIQQGKVCVVCGCNVRSIALAKSIMKNYNYGGLFKNFVDDYSRLKVLEINEAGNLNQFLNKFKKHKLASYPKVDMMKIPFRQNSFDLIVHSDTLEHVEDSIKALTENKRILRKDGVVCYTVPVIIGRITKDKAADRPSYHGSEENQDYLVVREYGADFWCELLKAGFDNIRIDSFEFPAGIAISAKK